MPMLTTLRMGLPVCPVHVAGPHPVARTPPCGRAPRAPPRRRRRRRPSSDAPLRHPQRDVQHRRGSRTTLMRSPRNIASVRSREPDSSASSTSRRERLVGDPVLRVVEVEAGGLGGQPLAAPRIVGEQVAEVDARGSRRGAARAPSRPGRRSGRCLRPRSRASAALFCVDRWHQVVPRRRRSSSAPSVCSFAASASTSIPAPRELAERLVGVAAVGAAAARRRGRGRRTPRASPRASC